MTSSDRLLDAQAAVPFIVWGALMLVAVTVVIAGVVLWAWWTTTPMMSSEQQAFCDELERELFPEYEHPRDPAGRRTGQEPTYPQRRLRPSCAGSQGRARRTDGVADVVDPHPRVAPDHRRRDPGAPRGQR